MKTDITIDILAVFKPLERASRYKAAYGGRGSGKSWRFASMVVERCLLKPGSRIVCIREVQKTLNQSAKALRRRSRSSASAPSFESFSTGSRLQAMG
jgi:phage terminase large subunit